MLLYGITNSNRYYTIAENWKNMRSTIIASPFSSVTFESVTGAWRWAVTNGYHLTEKVTIR